MGSAGYPGGTAGFTSAFNATNYIPKPVTSGLPPMKRLIFVCFDSQVAAHSPQEHGLIISRLQSPDQSQEAFQSWKSFAAIWHEGMGNAAPLRGGTKSLTSDHELMIVGKFSTKSYTAIRRMVVFNEMDQCAWCFPVHTYGRLGVAKASVSPSKHAAVYTKDQQPRYGPNEPKMAKEAIEVTPKPYQRLHAMS
ncbi:hypothetical protein BDV38DRAFT_280551 [Aspergillus pseudotamarii]|uniref:DUF6590 domain-containing protein n=1 Tax=Aspergillus pseudotamarii TaxID=132259 RepID=A0A5N6SZH4_ASPPS|nr:uncharacterized protein BDV38DRAFT_280551 [Aspergillus pseudotamarii]KAE8140086.1 hypothetical protein BDV38DRAFT_280551 [Aspergillus pseudotamarii]